MERKSGGLMQLPGAKSQDDDDKLSLLLTHILLLPYIVDIKGSKYTD